MMLKLTSKQAGFINGAVLMLVVAGFALGGLLLYGYLSGQELPFWPSIAVVLVNLVAAGKLVLNIRKAKRQQSAPTRTGSQDRAQ